uniref:Uncharacterized protein n=1 Tax=Brassica oleracea TaxID=3712 RepID=A0A3P6BN57_BRAOL|nr:unnamed protein product [Brassica oleracea]
MSQNGKMVPPNMDQNTHVTFYEFNIEISQWSRKDVVKRSKQQPRFQFIVMNRWNTDILVEDLLRDFEHEVQGPYLLYRNTSQEVNGIWFYNERAYEEVARLFDGSDIVYGEDLLCPLTLSLKWLDYLGDHKEAYMKNLSLYSALGSLSISFICRISSTPTNCSSRQIELVAL